MLPWCWGEAAAASSCCIRCWSRERVPLPYRAEQISEHLFAANQEAESQEVKTFRWFTVYLHTQLMSRFRVDSESDSRLYVSECSPDASDFLQPLAFWGISPDSAYKHHTETTGNGQRIRVHNNSQIHKVRFIKSLYGTQEHEITSINISI